MLLLGIPGQGHDGPNLTDTLMVASLDPQAKTVDLISLPRDLWIDKHKVKVNTLYHLGLGKGEGIEFVQQELGEVLGIRIPYGVRVDFSGFVKAVDLLNGIEVEIQTSFDDFAYPVPGKEKEMCDLREKELELDEGAAKIYAVAPGKIKALVDIEEKIATVATSISGDFEFTDQSVFKFFPCRFEHLEFTKGKTVMDGATALKFVRSRHGTGSEGSDFARSRRQQLVLTAFKNKLLSIRTLTDPAKLAGLLKTFETHVEVNIPAKNYIHFLDLVKNIREIHSFVIQPGGPNPLLVNPNYADFGGAFVLIPPKNDFSIIQRYVGLIIAGNYEATASASKKVEDR